MLLAIVLAQAATIAIALPAVMGKVATKAAVKPKAMHSSRISPREALMLMRMELAATMALPLVLSLALALALAATMVRMAPALII